MEKTDWVSLMAGLRFPENQETYDELVAAYSEKHRHYHTARHISQCLKEFSEAKNLAQKPDEVELALWFHDAVYDVFAKNSDTTCLRRTAKRKARTGPANFCYRTARTNKQQKESLI